MVSPPPATPTAIPQAMLHALDRVGAGVRKAGDTSDGSPTEIDLWLPSGAMSEIDSIAEEHGFHRFAARGHNGHRFYLGFHDHRWIKLDFKLTDTGRSRPKWLSSAARRLPTGLRRLGAVVAFVGPDGAGKGTVLEEVTKGIPVAVYVKRLGGKPPRKPRNRDTAQAPSAVSTTTPAWRLWLEPFFVTRMMLRRMRQLAGVYASAWRGRIVLCDRHPLDALAIDPRRTWLGRNIERLVVNRLLPWPDRVVVLDAPGHVMFARKGEHSPEVLEAWRRGYATTLSDPARRATIVSTDGNVQDAVNAASAVVWGALAERRRWPNSGP